MRYTIGHFQFSIPAKINFIILKIIFVLVSFMFIQFYLMKMNFIDSELSFLAKHSINHSHFPPIQILMSKYGWCLETRELKKRRHQFTSATWIQFSMPLSNSMCHGNKSGIVRWMYKLWILIPWVEMNWLANFSCNVSLYTLYVSKIWKYKGCFKYNYLHGKTENSFEVDCL